MVVSVSGARFEPLTSFCARLRSWKSTGESRQSASSTWSPMRCPEECEPEDEADRGPVALNYSRCVVANASVQRQVAWHLLLGLGF